MPSVHPEPAGAPPDDEIAIEDLFALTRRTARSVPRVLSALFVLLWFPFGLTLGAVRVVALALSMRLLLPRLPRGLARGYVRFLLFPLLGLLPWVVGRRHLHDTPNPKVARCE